ncbi:PRTRC system protein A [Pseudorhodoferax sp. Leaf267]|uniref:PRTRC system protein A n=1 Tax=Pseudorhodoferax sp. Leaf267 TaxID=1736316 RepID=UPI0006F6693F|nr:PRTRC system protein A [Pseudorhodoferax sp. Leaf267]KQP15165.1 PRTRC system protein A [Pseudorhodoferax sp. Leaf267]
MTDPRDLALQASCPVLAAPRFGPLPDMVNGQRVIVAANGVFVQVRLDWLDCVQRLAPPLGVPLPFGALQERLQFSFGVLPIRLIEDFIAAGRQGLPNEVAGVLVYQRRTRSLRLALCAPLAASPGRIAYRRPVLQEGETVAVDLHTHGCDRPFWSAEDDRDDQGIQVAGVFGGLHRSVPQAEFRLVLNGCYRALPHPWPRGAQAQMTETVAVRTAVPPSRLRRMLARWTPGGWPWNT